MTFLVMKLLQERRMLYVVTKKTLDKLLTMTVFVMGPTAGRKGWKGAREEQEQTRAA